MLCSYIHFGKFVGLTDTLERKPLDQLNRCADICKKTISMVLYYNNSAPASNDQT